MPKRGGCNKERKPAKSLRKDKSPSQTAEKSLSPAAPTEGDVRIICYDQAHLHEGTDVKEVARNTLNATLEGATYSQDEDSLTYGNSLGHRLIEERKEARARSARLDAKASNLQEMVSNLQETVSNLQETVSNLQGETRDLQAQTKEHRETSDGYLVIRRRFLETFRRDILGESDARGSEAIRKGNAIAHHGDAVIDAGLLNTGDLGDGSLMCAVYGLTADQVLSLSSAGDYQNITVLNARATLKAKKDVQVHQDIEGAWELFLSTLRERWGKSAADDWRSPLGRARRKFWDAYHKHKG